MSGMAGGEECSRTAGICAIPLCPEDSCHWSEDGPRLDCEFSLTTTYQVCILILRPQKLRLREGSQCLQYIHDCELSPFGEIPCHLAVRGGEEALLLVARLRLRQ